MKRKILILALFGLFFGKMGFGQTYHLCFNFVQSVSCPGGHVCASMAPGPTCVGSCASTTPYANCCESIPLGTGTVKFDGTGSCAALEWPPSSGCDDCLIYTVVITSGGTPPNCLGQPIHDTYQLLMTSPDGIVWTWQSIWMNAPSDNYISSGGVQTPDISLEIGGSGSGDPCLDVFTTGWGGPPPTDAQGNTVGM